MSLFNVIEEISILGAPTEAQPAFVPLELVSLWTRTNDGKPTSGKMRAYYVFPAGRESPAIELAIDLTLSHFHRTRINVGVLPIAAQGRYEFVIQQQESGQDHWEDSTQIPFDVTFKESG